MINCPNCFTCVFNCFVRVYIWELLSHLWCLFLLLVNMSTRFVPLEVKETITWQRNNKRYWPSLTGLPISTVCNYIKNRELASLVIIKADLRRPSQLMKNSRPNAEKSLYTPVWRITDALQEADVRMSPVCRRLQMPNPSVCMFMFIYLTGFDCVNMTSSWCVCVCCYSVWSDGFF